MVMGNLLSLPRRRQIVYDGPCYLTALPIELQQRILEFVFTPWHICLKLRRRDCYSTAYKSVFAVAGECKDTALLPYEGVLLASKSIHNLAVEIHTRAYTKEVNLESYRWGHLVTFPTNEFITRFMPAFAHATRLIVHGAPEQTSLAKHLLDCIPKLQLFIIVLPISNYTLGARVWSHPEVILDEDWDNDRFLQLLQTPKTNLHGACQAGLDRNVQILVHQIFTPFLTWNGKVIQVVSKLTGSGFVVVEKHVSPALPLPSYIQTNNEEEDELSRLQAEMVI